MKTRNISVVGLLALIGVLVMLLLPTLAAKSSSIHESAQPNDESNKPSSITAAGPLFNYQGMLHNAGAPLTNTSLPVTFRLYKALTGGSACWAENRNINVQNGQFSVVLGQVTAIPSSCVTENTYLEIVINGETLSPRELLTAAAVAVKAKTLTAGAETEGALTVGGNLTVAGMNLILGRDNGFGGNYVLRLDGSPILHILPWAGGSYPFNQVCIGCGGSAKLTVNGSTQVNGNLDLRGTCARTSLSRGSTNELAEANDECQPGSILSGAYVEANLMTNNELNSERIERFSEGDVLCWAGEQLEKCDQPNDRLVQAVASIDGKPVIVGAERVRVLGPVKMGDILVSSSIPGYAMVNNDPLPGTVISQALEDFDGEMGLIKAMIRKW